MIVAANDTKATKSNEERVKIENTIEKLRAESARDPENAAVWFNLGVAYHDLCNIFKVKCSENAVAALEKAYSIRPDAITLAYLGSSWTLVARDSDNPVKKIEGVMKGNEYLDEAVRLDPSHVVIRRIRYENNFALPDIFERKPIAESDVDFLIKLYAKDAKAFDGYYDPAHVFYFKAKFLSLRNDWKSAQKYAQIAQKIVKDSALAAEIERFLKGKE